MNNTIKFIMLLAVGFSAFLYFREPSLPKPLVEVKCASKNRQSHAQVSYGNAKVFHLCLTGNFWDKPTEETCHIYGSKKVCEKEGDYIHLTRTADGVVYGTYFQELMKKNLIKKEPTDKLDAPYESELRLFFNDHVKPYEQSQYQKMQGVKLNNIKDYLPASFTLTKVHFCDRVAEVFNTGSCAIEAKTHSLEWFILVTIRKKARTEITESDYRNELIFWRPYLASLVIDK